LKEVRHEIGEANHVCVPLDVSPERLSAIASLPALDEAGERWRFQGANHDLTPNIRQMRRRDDSVVILFPFACFASLRRARWFV